MHFVETRFVATKIPTHVVLRVKNVFVRLNTVCAVTDNRQTDGVIE